MKKNIFIAILLLMSMSLAAQTFTGTVYYKSSLGKTEVLPFAQVYNIEAKKLIETDENGVFSLTINTTTTLVATYVGYTRDTVVVNPGMTKANFYLSGTNEVEESIVSAKQSSLSKLNPIKTEVITAAGLCKMACCSLAESFENSASVTVGYSDAVTGAKQIKLLGLSGTYTQMLDENRPVMRGLASPFGMSYVPGQWLESIQIAKGPSSVVNGNGAITGQINMEHRKPTDETPLFVNLYGSTDAMTEANIASAVQFNPKWNTILLAHYNGTQKSMDHNGDGFRDDPLTQCFSIQNRWLYYQPDNGFQVRFGIKALQDDRLGGQTAYEKSMNHLTSQYWGSRILNKNLNAYLKVGYPLNEDQSSSIAIVSDLNWYNMDSFFGRNDYTGTQTSGFLNALYQNNSNENHGIEFGLSAQMDRYAQQYSANSYGLNATANSTFDEKQVCLFGEYTYTNGDKVTAVAGARVDYNSLYGVLFAPRGTFKWSITDNLIARLSGGRGFHTPMALTDNMGNFSTSGLFKLYRNNSIKEASEGLLSPFGVEEAWTYGGNITAYLPFGVDNNSFISLEYFRNDFINQLIADQEYMNGLGTMFYELSQINGGRSFTNTYQADLSSDLFDGFNAVLTYRYTDAKVTVLDPETNSAKLVERPMTSRYKAVLNMQYATPMNIWTFDFTVQLNGPMRLPSFMSMDYSPAYPMLYAQITKKFDTLDLYTGCENINNFRQHEAILNADNPFANNFNASCVWGPLMGRKFYIGIRYTLWK